MRRGTSDIGIGGLSVTYARSQVAHFTARLYFLEYGIAASLPRPRDPFNNVITVFTTTVWLWVLASFASIIVMFAAIQAVVKWYTNNCHTYKK